LGIGLVVCCYRVRSTIRGRSRFGRGVRMKSAQRELNPHIRHGKAVGYRYIMGASWCAELSRNEYRDVVGVVARERCLSWRGARGIWVDWLLGLTRSVRSTGLVAVRPHTECEEYGLLGLTWNVRSTGLVVVRPHTECEEYRSTGRDSNPRCRITGAVSWPLDDQCSIAVGSEGLEPSPGRLRVCCAAASTLIPVCFHL
jgi:hypothetical protein